MSPTPARPGPVEVTLPDGSTYVIRRLLSEANHKQAKGTAYRAVGLTLTPRATGRAGLNLCPFATPGCARSCFADFDRMAWPAVKRAAVARTRLLAQAPATFRALLEAELDRAGRNPRGGPLVVRLNVVSDVAWEREFPGFFAGFPFIQFYDYTKDCDRVLDSCRPFNYHLILSRSERNEADCLRALAAGHTVAVVFRKPPFPAELWGYPVIDGDRDDWRWTDPAPCIVGLKAKGAGARRDATGFVLPADAGA